MALDNVKFLKNLHKWPLSKVDLCEYQGKLIVRKSVHKNFGGEVGKQRFLYSHCIRTDIPEIIDSEDYDNKVVFYMEYIKSARKATEQDAVNAISAFHNETIGIESDLFQCYNYDSFLEDVEYVKNALNDSLPDVGGVKEIFGLQMSVVHGDWGADQLLVKGDDYYVIDFGKSFIGPPIIDFGFQFLKKDIYEKSVPFEHNLITKSRVIAAIRVIRWYMLCRERYVDYNYEKEIEELSSVIKHCLNI
jgi:hypothetical protein